MGDIPLGASQPGFLMPSLGEEMEEKEVEEASIPSALQEQSLGLTGGYMGFLYGCTTLVCWSNNHLEVTFPIPFRRPVVFSCNRCADPSHRGILQLLGPPPKE